MKILLGTLLTVSLLFAGCSEKSYEQKKATLSDKYCHDHIKGTDDGYMYKGLTDLEFNTCLEVFKETKEKALSDNSTKFKVKVLTKEEQMAIINQAQTDQYENTEYVYDEDQKAQGMHGMDGKDDGDYWNIDVEEEIEEVK